MATRRTSSRQSHLHAPDSPVNSERTPVKGYGVPTEADEIGPFDFTRRPVGELDVKIKLLTCGICHSDIHHAYNEWKDTIYPVVPGHEMMGLVIEIGAKVTKIRLQQRVAIGNLVNCCRRCTSCHEGREQYCLNGGPSWVYNGHERNKGELFPVGEPTFGGYSEMIVVDEDFVIPVPDELDMARSTPLLCAGITVYSPLKQSHLKKGMVVGVAGIGGLGHLAIKFARAMWPDMTIIAFTRTLEKSDDILDNLGASRVVYSPDDSQMRQVAGQIDVLINTIPHPHDFNPYLNTLKIDGKMWVLGVMQETEKSFNANKLNFFNRSICGSTVGGIRETKEMLEFCAKHNVQADVEIVDIQDLRNHFDNVRNSQVRYRYVIDLRSLTEEQ